MTEDSANKKLEKFLVALDAFRESLGTPANFQTASEIGKKQLNNFCKNCKINDPYEVLALIDTTLLKSGKDGIAFCENRIVWRNFAFDEPQSIAYSDLYKDSAYTVKGTDLHITACGKSYKFSAVRSEIELDDMEKLIRRVVDYWRNNYCELSEDEKFEKKVLNEIKTPGEQYFPALYQSIMKSYRGKAVSNLIDDALDVFLAVSYEQTNDAFRRNALAENSTEKKISIAVSNMLQIAVCFPGYLAKHGSFNPDLINKMKNDYVTFEVLTYVIYKVNVMLKNYLQDKADLITAELMERSLIPFVQFHEKELFQNKSNLDAVLNDPMEKLNSSKVMEAFADRMHQYSFFAEEDCFEMLRQVFRSLVSRRISAEDNLNDHENLVYRAMQELYSSKMNPVLQKFVVNLDKALDGTLAYMLS